MNDLLAIWATLTTEERVSAWKAAEATAAADWGDAGALQARAGQALAEADMSMDGPVAARRIAAAFAARAAGLRGRAV